MQKSDLKFLVVDDFAAMRKVVKNTLVAMGYSNFVEAENGKMAYDIVVAAAQTNQPIQFVISDWNMPVMEGIDLLVKCRAEEVTKKLPFILVTAENEKQHIQRAVIAGVSDYVVKPFTQQTLRDKIERVMTANKAVLTTGGGL